jgi:peptidyl-prolyl cis-trans isomerase C
MKRTIIVSLLLIASHSVQAQQTDTQSASASDNLGPGEVAIVNGQRLPESIFRLFTIGALQVDPDALPPVTRKEIVDRLVVTMLLAQEAERRGLDQERRIAAQLELQRLETLANFMSERFARENPPTEAELRAAYEETLPQFDRIEYKARHIIVETERQARRIIDDLDDGDDFIELANEYSTGPTASEGGDLGWITVDAVDEPFAAALAATTPGTHNPEPVQTEFGWHVIRVDESRQSAPPTLSAIQDQLIAALNNVRLAQYVELLVESSEVEIKD